MDNKLMALLAIIALITVAVLGSDGDMFAVFKANANKDYYSAKTNQLITTQQPITLIGGASQDIYFTPKGTSVIIEYPSCLSSMNFPGDSVLGYNKNQISVPKEYSLHTTQNKARAFTVSPGTKYTLTLRSLASCKGTMYMTQGTMKMTWDTTSLPITWKLSTVSASDLPKLPKVTITSG